MWVRCKVRFVITQNSCPSVNPQNWTSYVLLKCKGGTEDRHSHSKREESGEDRGDRPQTSPESSSGRQIPPGLRDREKSSLAQCSTCQAHGSRSGTPSLCWRSWPHSSAGLTSKAPGGSYPPCWNHDHFWLIFKLHFPLLRSSTRLRGQLCRSDCQVQAGQPSFPDPVSIPFGLNRWYFCSYTPITPCWLAVQPHPWFSF